MTSLSDDEDSDLEFRRLPDYPTLFPYQADAHQEERRVRNLSSCAAPSRPSNQQPHTSSSTFLDVDDEEEDDGMLDDDLPMSEGLVLGLSKRGTRASVPRSALGMDDSDEEADDEDDDYGMEGLQVAKQERKRSRGTKRRRCRQSAAERKESSKPKGNPKSTISTPAHKHAEDQSKERVADKAENLGSTNENTAKGKTGSILRQNDKDCCPGSSPSSFHASEKRNDKQTLKRTSS